MAKHTHCWNCGEVLNRVTDEPVIVGKHAYCSHQCAQGVAVENPDYPVDYDEADRMAAASERIDNFRSER
jgi:hypothetical protein